MAYTAALYPSLTLAGLAAATSYAVGPIILLTAVPAIIIANAYRRLNLWNANCGASILKVGARSIVSRLFTGWLMIAPPHHWDDVRRVGAQSARPGPSMPIPAPGRISPAWASSW
jgi:hypothetical protein